MSTNKGYQSSTEFTPSKSNLYTLLICISLCRCYYYACFAVLLSIEFNDLSPINSILELGFEQMVKFSTRLDNTLDLVLTSHPGFMPRCKPLHPISMKNYHDIVLYDTSIQPTRAKPQRRKIYLWKRANINAIRREFRNFEETFSKDQLR